MFASLVNTLLDLLLPQKAEVRRIETMTPSAFARAAKREWQIDPFPRIFARFAYEEPIVRRAVHELKYRGNEKIAALLGALLYETLLAEAAEEALFLRNERALLIPVPLSPQRLRERGFNQTELLAKAILSCDGGACFEYARDVLLKTRNTESQTKTKSRKERLKNLSGTFAVSDAARVSGRRIIVIDDVVTTGATMQEAMRVLRAGGAREVRGIAVAH